MTVLALSALGVAAAIQSAPLGALTDPRIRRIDYVPDGVITVPVSTGVVTRVVLERGEKIIAAATGKPSKCDSDDHLWCVVADADAQEVWVKPKAGARHNNLELKTDRRDYSFDFEVGALKTYRVNLRYPAAAPPVTALGSADDKAIVAERLAAARPEARNSNYTLEANTRGADITPRAVFDDGNFTYFRFPGNTEVPTVFVIGSDGKEARTNFAMEGDTLVVQRLGRKFVLRLGASVVSVWNERFDAQGTPAKSGTTVSGVARDVVGANDEH